MAMEKITKASVTSRAVAEEKSKAEKRFDGLLTHTPLGGGFVAERLHFFMNQKRQTKRIWDFFTKASVPGDVASQYRRPTASSRPRMLARRPRPSWQTLIRFWFS